MHEIPAAKRAARAAASVAREVAHSAGDGAARAAAAHALRAIGSLGRVRPVAGYLPIRSEIDPLPAMLALRGLGYPICVPVIEGKALPLRFRTWTPEAAVVRDAYGVASPESGDWMEPEVLLVPLLAFDDQGYRLGYGGGFYDRTLERLRAGGDVLALGFAYEAQRLHDLPRTVTDARLDAVVTEAGFHSHG